MNNGKRYAVFLLSFLTLLFCIKCGDISRLDSYLQGNDGNQQNATYRIVDVQVENHITYRLAHPQYPHWTGDLWPSAWGDDDRLYTANGDGIAFGNRLLGCDIVFSIVDGSPLDMVGYTPPDAYREVIAGLWGPDENTLTRKPTGMVCVDGDIYLFFQNLRDDFGDAPHASISVTHDKGLTWEYETSQPMFTDHVFTTGFFLDYGKCQEHAVDDYIYVYGLDYNWRFTDTFAQTKMYLARVPRDRIMERSAWEFFTGLDNGTPEWSPEIEDKVTVIEDETKYACGGKSGICQGSVVYIPQLKRYLYSTRSKCSWMFWEAEQPWGPWTRVAVVDWKGEWTEEYHAGYNAMIFTKYLDADGRGGWIVSSLSSSTFDGKYYNMGFRRFTLEVEKL
ncbi:MAG: DUF4185 domain-containing protein [bacterium]